MARIGIVAALSCSVIMGVGCGGGNSDYKKSSELKKAPAVHEHHDHGHAKGPHGGSLVELGAEEYHAEVVLDHDAHALRVFILGKDAKTATPTTAKEVTLTPEGKDALTLKAAPQDGDGDGKASKFELIDDEVVHTLLDAKFLHAKLKVTIADKPFTGDVDYHLDDVHHDHKDEMPADKEPKKEDDKPAAKDEPAKETEPK